MLTQIKKLGLPMGVWQTKIKEILKPLNTESTCKYPNSTCLSIEVNESNKNVASFRLSFLPGCKGIIVSHAMLVNPEYRGLGIAKKLQVIKENIIKDLQASAIIATVREDNEVEKKVIKDWNKLDSFLNKKTSNQVGIYLKLV
jgi:hypothetical protein